MELSKLVTSLETSQRLKELGVKQNSYFYWILNEKGSDKPFVHYAHQPLSRKRYSAAFTSSELGEMLQKSENVFARIHPIFKGPVIYREKGEWIVQLTEGHWYHVDTEAEARGKLLIYLLENNLLGKH